MHMMMNTALAAWSDELLAATGPAAEHV